MRARLCVCECECICACRLHSVTGHETQRVRDKESSNHVADARTWSVQNVSAGMHEHEKVREDNGPGGGCCGWLVMTAGRSKCREPIKVTLSGVNECVTPRVFYFEAA